MKANTYPNTRYGKGSTGFHIAHPPQASDGGSGGAPSRSRGFRVLAIGIRNRLASWQTQRYREYLKWQCELLAACYLTAFGYIQLIIRFIVLRHGMIYHEPDFPSEVIQLFIHDRRYALFRRKAVSFQSSKGYQAEVGITFPEGLPK